LGEIVKQIPLFLRIDRSTTVSFKKIKQFKDYIFLLNKKDKL
jgi:hypothetical protein